MWLNVLDNIMLPRALMAKPRGGIEVGLNMDSHMDMSGQWGCPGQSLYA